jgi:predicted CxxxxCH...CXXCH cytochrome family protein
MLNFTISKNISMILLRTGVAIIASALMLISCSSANQNAIINPDTGQHAANWYVDHRAAYITNPGMCATCHGSDLHGGITGISCFTASFKGMSCHANGPAGHPTGWASPDSHGAAAKAEPNAANVTGLSSCQACHGFDFTGGMANRTCLNTAGCHGPTIAAPHSPAPWRGGARTHTTAAASNAPECGLCHLGGRTPPAYVPVPAGTQPGCFNNTLCHGSNVVPHAIPFTDPALHGPAAKADLTYCEGCHASPSAGGAGSNPRFNVPVGSLPAGCETAGCHDAKYAHPTQWRGLTATAPGGHMTAGNLAAACALCHGVNLAGGTGPACSTCHTAGSPLTLGNCTSCHSSPPTGSTTPNRTGSHTTHNAMTGVTGICNTCHNGGGTKTANHDYGRGAVYVSFLSAYNAKSGTAAFDANANTCSNVVCHGGPRTQSATQGNANPPQSTLAQTPNWLTGAIDVNTQCTACHVLGPSAGNPENNSYYSGQHRRHVYGQGKACTACHDTTKLAPVHFTSFTAPILPATASATINSAVNFNGSSCNPSAGGLTGCHGSESW